MIVDDRLAIIGSANINERSQRGDRDSELACVVRDTDMLDSYVPEPSHVSSFLMFYLSRTMAGKPFKVGRFAHTLRVRLMREHLGVDVDRMYTDDLLSRRPVHPEEDIKKWDPDQEEGAEYEVTKVHTHGTISRMKDQAHAPLEQGGVSSHSYSTLFHMMICS